MKLGSFEWKPLGFLTEEIKNTRFLITIMNDVFIMGIILGIFYMIVMNTSINEVLFGAITLVLGYLVGRGQSAAQMYFDSRKETTISIDDSTLKKES